MISLLDILIEGGWESKLTQNTKLTPAVVKECVELFEKFIKNFNEHLRSKNMQEVEAGRPVGSSTYYKVDKPEKEYGDVDMLFYIPRIEGTTDYSNQSIYAKEILSYLKGKKDIQSENGKNLIFKLKNGNYAQIDLINAYIENKEWAAGRYTPERGTKGAIGGYMYSALSEVLNFSMNTHGVQMKIKNGAPVKFATTQKPDKLETITKNINNFGVDVCKYYYKLITNKDDKKMIISPNLKKHPGVDPENVKNEDIVNVVKGIGETLQSNKLFGKGALSHIDSYEDYINKIANSYATKMKKGIESTKFDKAEGPEGVRKAKEAKEKLTAGLKQMLQYLK